MPSEDDVYGKYGKDIIKSVLASISEGGIEPKRLPGGGYSYEEVKAILPEGVDPEGLLEDMVKEGLLSKRPIGSTLRCPKDRSSNFVPIFTCHTCGSQKVRREKLYEHKIGGHMGPESLFRQGERMVCPVCGKEVSERDLRVIGAWFTCDGCGSKNPNVAVKFRCLNDGEIFDVFTGDFAQIYAYELTSKGRAGRLITKPEVVELVRGLLASIIGDGVLRNELVGKSGLRHTFDFVFRGKDGTRIVMDVLFSNDVVSENDILTFFAKYYDVSSPEDRPALLIWPKMGEKATSLAKFYKIRYKEVSDPSELREAVEEVVS